MCNYDALRMEAVEEEMNDDQEAIEILEEYLEKSSKNLESIDTDLGNLSVIAGNLQDITDKMKLTMFQMDVLADLRKLKEIYHLTHEEWMALTIDEMLELVEGLEEVGHPKPCILCMLEEEDARK